MHCGNVEGSKNRWLLLLRRYGRKMFGRDKPLYSEAAELTSEIHACVRTVAQEKDIIWRWEENDTV
ncbi:MAG TPA: hypothetical protein PKM20_10565 [Nitrosomonas sp.]|nr:hypothetical protein [Nitrosomonas sp.]HNP27172.1 hypothetical protein [Nitrosomonas sp.]